MVGALPSQYHVEDTWENYEKLKARIDERFAEWQAGKAEKARPESKPKKKK
jgi:hypothetical protein